MPKPFKSPWEFGELFRVERTRKVLTVAELTTADETTDRKTGRRGLGHRAK